MTNSAVESTPIVYARVAGILFILIILIGLFNGIFIDSKLIISDNIAATVSNILAHDLLFRAGIASILILYAGVAVLSWALYVILKTVNRNLALLAMLLRAGEAILGAATVLVSFIVLDFANGNGFSQAFEAEQLHALVVIFLNVRTAGLDMVLVFVGLGGTLFCYLFYISKYVPKFLAGWGIFTYISMLMLALISILFPNHPLMIEYLLYGFGALFEVIFGFWLVIKGVNLRQWEVHVSDSA